MDKITGEIEGELPDGTAASQAQVGVLPATTEEIALGYKKLPVERTSPFDPDETPGENQVGDPFTFGGFLGRPMGTAR